MKDLRENQLFSSVREKGLKSRDQMYLYLYHPHPRNIEIFLSKNVHHVEIERKKYILTNIFQQIYFIKYISSNIFHQIYFLLV